MAKIQYGVKPDIFKYAHNTQHTTHNTQHTTHNTQHTTHNTQHTTHNTTTKQQQHNPRKWPKSGQTKIWPKSHLA